MDTPVEMTAVDRLIEWQILYLLVRILELLGLSADVYTRLADIS